MGQSLAVEYHEVGAVVEFFQGLQNNGPLPEAEQTGDVGEGRRSLDRGPFDEPEAREFQDHHRPPGQTFPDAHVDPGHG